MDSLSDTKRAIAESVRSSAAGRVQVAVADMDGILRGKVIHVDAFQDAMEGGLGMNIFGYDLKDEPIDRSHCRKSVGDAKVRLDLDTYRPVPWDSDTPFFLGEFVNPDGSPHPLCPRQLLRRVLARIERLGFQARIGSEYEFFNFRETPETWARKEGLRPDPIDNMTLGMSLLGANTHRDYFNALWTECARFKIPLESLHTETGPGVYEAVVRVGDALDTADAAVLFKEAAKEIGSRFGIMPSFMAKWHSKHPGCSGHVHQSLTDGSANVFFQEGGRYGGMSSVFESYLAGQLAFLREMGPMFWPTVNSYKRLVPGFLAPVRFNWGLDNRCSAFRVLTASGSAKSVRMETRCPGADMNAYLAFAAILSAGVAGIEKKLKLETPPVNGEADDKGAPRAPRTLIEATRLFRESECAREWFGDAFVEYYASTREWECSLWLDAVTDWERKRYFDSI